MQCRECDLPIQWRCHDCFGVADLCTACCVQSHRYLPFHRISKWTGDCFVRSSLRHTGLTLFLGHRGLRCDGSWDTGTHSPSMTHHTRTTDHSKAYPTVSIDPGLPVEGNAVADPHLTPQTFPSNAADVDSSLSHSLSDSLTLAMFPPEASLLSQVHSPAPPVSITDALTPHLSSMTENATTEHTNDSSTIHSNTDATTAGTSTAKDDIPRGLDVNGNPWITIVDITGVHHLPMHSCTCGHSSESTFVQLLRLSLYPCSTERPRTVFTFRLLEDFDLENLETKASAQSFYSKLRRITNNVSPHLVPDRYRELMRVLREWRNLMSMKRMGYGHSPKSGMSPPAGGLALFCPACPQPDVNLPRSWIDNASE